MNGSSMMSLTRAEFFRHLGAPLVNERWSWGAESTGGAVYLAVWKDQIRSDSSGQRVLVVHGSGRRASTGWRERLYHVRRIRSGVPAFCVVCVSEVPTPGNRRLLYFEQEDLLIGGALQPDVEPDGQCDIWLEIVGRVSVVEHVGRQRGE